MGCVYLLHFERPMAQGGRHYVGFTEDIDRRLDRHHWGSDAATVRAETSRGNRFVVVYLRDGASKRDEARIKHHAPRFCAICQERASFEDYPPLGVERDPTVVDDRWL